MAPQHQDLEQDRSHCVLQVCQFLQIKMFVGILAEETLLVLKLLLTILSADLTLNMTLTHLQIMEV